MQTELVNVGDRTYRAMEIRAHVNLIQEVMEAVMVKDVHYGIIPGTPKPTLYKPGAEKLLVTFRVSPESFVEDLSTDDAARFRVIVKGTSIITGVYLGSGVGECSSDEEKYKWRKPVCDQEWDETPIDRRREVWKKTAASPAKIKQIRTNKADLSNTILKMADKRGYVALALKTTAASDIFDQDIEDIPEEIRDVRTDGDVRPKIESPKPKTILEGLTYKVLAFDKVEPKQVPKKDKSGTFEVLKFSTKEGWTGEVAGFLPTAKLIGEHVGKGTLIKVGFSTNKFGNKIETAEVVGKEPGEDQTQEQADV